MAELKHHPGYWLRDDAAAAFDAAEDAHGVFQLTSAGRTVGEQVQLINRWFAGGVYNRPPYLYEPARPPETSAHVAEGGIAVDIADWQRFATIAADYGFDKPHAWDVVHFEFRGRSTTPTTTRRKRGGDMAATYYRNKDGKIGRFADGVKLFGSLEDYKAHREAVEAELKTHPERKANLTRPPHEGNAKNFVTLDDHHWAIELAVHGGTY